MTRSETESALAAALACPGVVSAYLFGSVAEERDHRESDIDVGVLLDRAVHSGPRERFGERLRLSSTLSSAARGRSVDVVILNDAPATLVRHIVMRGRRILCMDPERDRCFVRDAQLLAADLEPFLQRMRRIKLEALGSDDVSRRTTG